METFSLKSPLPLGMRGTNFMKRPFSLHQRHTSVSLHREGWWKQANPRNRLSDALLAKRILVGLWGPFFLSYIFGCCNLEEVAVHSYLVCQGAVLDRPMIGSIMSKPLFTILQGMRYFNGTSYCQKMWSVGSRRQMMLGISAVDVLSVAGVTY